MITMVLEPKWLRMMENRRYLPPRNKAFPHRNSTTINNGVICHFYETISKTTFVSKCPPWSRSSEWLESYLYFVTVSYYLQYVGQPIGMILTRVEVIECLGRFCRTTLWKTLKRSHPLSAWTRSDVKHFRDENQQQLSISHLSLLWQRIKNDILSIRRITYWNYPDACRSHWMFSGEYAGESLEKPLREHTRSPTHVHLATVNVDESLSMAYSKQDIAQSWLRLRGSVHWAGAGAR